eukprot:TRINITY_DN13395_c0_g1_i2.p1 TRINITY_DN13395_c0_g1~~TRINITY_DN13395_c0_g1_i2.p1  ORF type:complete len:371 (-),score=77.06 TRINITY_DN13395_c0_g1_i2:41-1096(-)
MAPKRRASPKTSTSPAPKARGSSRGAAKSSPRRQASPAPKEDPPAPKEDPRKVEARELFERYEPDGKLDGGLKLAQFANIIRDVNIKKLMLWGDDPCNIIRREWQAIGGSGKIEVTLADFQAWWPGFADGVEQEWEDMQVAENSKKASIAKAEAEKYGHDGVWQIKVADLTTAMDMARKKGKTPLIIDNTPHLVTESFFQYNGSFIFECKKWIVEKAKGKPLEEIFEEERSRFYTAAKCFTHGRTVVFRMANSACDILGMFNDVERFPVAALLDAGEVVKCIGCENASNMEASPLLAFAPSKMDKAEMCISGIPQDFNVVVITQFEEDTFKEYLEAALPLHLLQPMKPCDD